MAYTFLTFNTTKAIPIYSAAIVDRVDNCNGYRATNTGDTIAWVDGQILYPGIPGTSLGDSVTVGGNFGEIFLGHIKVEFDTTGGGTQPEIQIDQKFYVLPGNKVVIKPE